MERMWGIKAGCKHYECRHQFVVDRGGDRSGLFRTEEEAIVALREEKVRDWLTLAGVVQGAMGNMVGKMPAARETPSRVLKCPTCGRSAIFTAEELYVEFTSDFFHGIEP